MASNFFLFGEALTSERLGWIAETLKLFFLSLHPDALRHPSREKEPFFIFFLTGDALYSLHDEELLRFWDIILSLPSVCLVCNRNELNLRGLSVASLKIKYPNIVLEKECTSHPGAYWQEVVKACRGLEPKSGSLGYLQLESPYMNRSSNNCLDSLSTASEEGIAPELYACLDGIHIFHTNQQPIEFRNIGNECIAIMEQARRKNLTAAALACSRSAAARGYNTWDDGKGSIISACIHDPCKIRNLSVLAERFRHNHCILGRSAAAIDISLKPATPPTLPGKKELPIPPLVLIIPHTPYGTEYTYGGLSLATACAHQEIPTRVIFIEDGIYSLTGVQSGEPGDQFFIMQEIIDAAAANENLEFYGYLPSFAKRGIQKNRKLNAVMDIGTNELAHLLFSPPAGAVANHQRILFF